MRKNPIYFCIKFLLFLFLVCFLTPNSKSFAANFVVTDPTDSIQCSNPMTNCSLRGAIRLINGGTDVNNTITLNGQTFVLDLSGTAADDNNATGDLDIVAPGRRVSIVGAGWGLTRLSVSPTARLRDRALHVVGGEVSLRNLSIVGGWTRGNGGAIYVNAGGTLILNQVQLANNHSENGCGGAIFNSGVLNVSEVSIASNTVGRETGNFTGYTGGSWFESGGLGPDTRGYFEDPSNGGAICNSGSVARATVTNTTMNGNTALRYGGAIYNERGAVMDLTNVTISGNTAAGRYWRNDDGNDLSIRVGQGGGIFNSSTLNVLNATIINNQASVSGGGIHNGAVALRSSDNQAGTTAQGSGAFAIRNSILQHNILTRSGDPGENCGASNNRNDVILTTLGNNISDDNTCTGVFTLERNDMSNITVPLSDLDVHHGGPNILYLHHLLGGRMVPNPAFDTVTYNPESCPPTDGRTFSRPLSARCDVGAFEADRVMGASNPFLSGRELSFGLPLAVGTTRQRTLIISSIASGIIQSSMENLLRSVQVTGSDASLFTVSSTDPDCMGSQLSSTTPCSLVITFAPNSQGTKRARLTVASNAVNTVDNLFTIDLVGVANAVTTPTSPPLGESVYFSADEMSFVSPVGGSTSQTVTVENISPDPIAVDFVVYSGAGFSVVSTCSSTEPLRAATRQSQFNPLTRETYYYYTGGGTCTATISFAPRDTMPVRGNASFDIRRGSEGPIRRTMTLNGQGVESNIVLEGAPSSQMQFGNVMLGRPVSLGLTIRNTGQRDLSLSRIALAPESDPAFSVNNPCVPSLVPNGSCQATITFRPSALRAYEARLAIESNDPDSPTMSVNLIGQGVAGVIMTLQDHDVTGSPGGTVEVRLTIERSGFVEAIPVTLEGGSLFTADELIIPAVDTLPTAPIAYNRSLVIRIPSNIGAGVSYGLAVDARVSDMISAQRDNVTVHIVEATAGGSGGSGGSSDGSGGSGGSSDGSGGSPSGSGGETAGSGGSEPGTGGSSEGTGGGVPGGAGTGGAEAGSGGDVGGPVGGGSGVSGAGGAGGAGGGDVNPGEGPGADGSSGGCSCRVISEAP